jgi:hypothetical protein
MGFKRRIKSVFKLLKRFPSKHFLSDSYFEEIGKLVRGSVGAGWCVDDIFDWQQFSPHPPTSIPLLLFPQPSTLNSFVVLSLDQSKLFKLFIPDL